VGFVGDLLPFDIVEVALEFAEAFDFEHAAEDAGELGGEQDLAPVLGVVDVHGAFLAVGVKGDEAVCCAAGHVVPLREEGLFLLRLSLSGGHGRTYVNAVDGIAIPDAGQPVLRFIFRLDNPSVNELKEARPVVAIVFTETLQEPVGLS